MQIRQATSPSDIAAARTLLQEYADDIGVDLCFQGFNEELAQLPGSYAPPQGRLLIAWSDDNAAGCVALRPLTATICELKRLFVRPPFRGRGIGKSLVEAIIREAGEIGYTTMQLDTLHTMTAATQLYESLGFVHRTPYYETPLVHTVFMERPLR
ncbi:MAG TPA: GNAT family N-acetyltransferase [Lacipirellulaceae bacterium]|jgi:ribosomal protein S18 acetylase RimI-like enzyme|nr:GNAT family N-acetyltransferase [Lacipirellulaceae bacterium]